MLGGGVNMCKAQINIKKHLKPEKIHRLGGGLSTLNLWGLNTHPPPPEEGVKISLPCLHCLNIIIITMVVSTRLSSRRAISL